MIYKEQFFIGRCKETGKFVSLKKENHGAKNLKIISILVKPVSHNGKLF